MKRAEKRICICKETANHVYIDTINGVETEFEALDGYYCTKCNSFWREP